MTLLAISPALVQMLKEVEGSGPGVTRASLLKWPDNNNRLIFGSIVSVDQFEVFQEEKQSVSW